MSTYTYTSTYTSTRIEVVAKQFERGLLSAGISQKRINKILLAIKEKKLQAIGIYALDSDSKRVAEIEISVDWSKHENQIKIYGDQFEYLGAINHKTGEAAETKVYVNSLIQLAKENDFELGCWIRAADSVKKNSQEYKKLMKSLGFGGDVEAWKSNPDLMKSDTLLAVEEMKIRLRGVSGDSKSHKAGVNQRIQRRLKKAEISLILNSILAVALILVLIICNYKAFDNPWINYMTIGPTLSYLNYYLVGKTWSDNKYGGWTKYDTTLLISVLIANTFILLNVFVFSNNLQVSIANKIVLFIYNISVFALTTYRSILFLSENGASKQKIIIHKVLAITLYTIITIMLVISIVHGLQVKNLINNNDTVMLESSEQDGIVNNVDDYTINDVDDYSNTYMVRLNTMPLALRVDPDTSSPLYRYIPVGTVLTITETVPGSNGLLWGYTSYEIDNGWVCLYYTERVYDY